MKATDLSLTKTCASIQFVKQNFAKTSNLIFSKTGINLEIRPFLATVTRSWCSLCSGVSQVLGKSCKKHPMAGKHDEMWSPGELNIFTGSVSDEELKSTGRRRNF